MTDRFRDRLSEFRDGELSPVEEELTRKHLETCPECAATLADLARVVERAARLPDRRLETDLWPGIESRITGDVRPAPKPTTSTVARPAFGRRIAFSIPQLAAAAITLASVSAAGAWMATASHEAPVGPATDAPKASGAALVADDDRVDSSAVRVATAIADLERALFDPAHPLPPETATAIRRSLVKIDRAIEDAQTALEELPGDPYLREHMDQTIRQKAEFLRRAVQLSQG